MKYTVIYVCSSGNQTKVLIEFEFSIHTYLSFFLFSDIDECIAGQCQNGGDCTDGVNAYTCDCPSGFTGVRCEFIDYCVNHSCDNGSSCINDPSNNQYLCQCSPGYDGTLCENSNIKLPPPLFSIQPPLLILGTSVQNKDGTTEYMN